MLIPIRPRVRDDLLFREIEGDLVVYDPVTDKTALFNVTAAAILDLCDGSHSLREITTEAVRLFNAENEIVGKEVERLLQELESLGLLQESPDP